MSNHLGFTPTGANILVRKDVRTQTEKVLDSGIIIPQGTTANDPISSGIVMAIGPSIDDRDLYINVGDKVVFSPWTGFAMSLKGEAGYLLMGEHEILGLFQGEAEDVMVR